MTIICTLQHRKINFTILCDTNKLTCKELSQLEERLRLLEVSHDHIFLFRFFQGINKIKGQ